MYHGEVTGLKPGVYYDVNIIANFTVFGFPIDASNGHFSDERPIYVSYVPKTGVFVASQVIPPPNNNTGNTGGFHNTPTVDGIDVYAIVLGITLPLLCIAMTLVVVYYFRLKRHKHTVQFGDTEEQIKMAEIKQRVDKSMVSDKEKISIIDRFKARKYTPLMGLEQGGKALGGGGDDDDEDEDSISISQPILEEDEDNIDNDIDNDNNINGDNDGDDDGDNDGDAVDAVHDAVLPVDTNDILDDIQEVLYMNHDIDITDDIVMNVEAEEALVPVVIDGDIGGGDDDDDEPRDGGRSLRLAIGSQAAQTIARIPDMS
jgi:hypothetical protein